MANLISLEEFRKKGRSGRRGFRQRVFFDRRELCQLLDMYSRRVMRGEWRDYAIDHRPGHAAFSVFRHSSERPVFSITKTVLDSKGRTEYGLYEGAHRLERASDLGSLIDAIDRIPKLIWSSS